MSNSSLITYANVTRNHKTSPRNHPIDTITIHCYVGQVTAKQGCDMFATTDRSASCNYVVGKDGSIGLCVDECDRSWCSSNAENDHRAITIEVASDSLPPYKITDEAYKALVNLCYDICKRNNISKLVWSIDKINRVNHINGCNMTVHRDFAAKSCPGDYIYERLGIIAEEVNKMLGTTTIKEVQEDANMELTRIMGNSKIPLEYMQKVFNAKGIGEYADMLKYYYEAEQHYGVRADIAISQSLLETGWFKFMGYAKPWMNNYAGLGVTDKNANANVGVFPSPFIGIVAQMQHLLAYASKEDPAKLYSGWVVVDNRFGLVQRSCAEYVEWLGQKENPLGKGWATGKDYGYKIMKIYNDILSEYEQEKKEAIKPVDEMLLDLYDIKARCDIKDYKVFVNPTRVSLYDEPNGKPINILKRGEYIITEEQDGFGLVKGTEGWILLSFTSYICDVEEDKE